MKLLTLLLMLTVFLFIGCREEKKQVVVVIDFKELGWRLMDGDSIWWSMGRWITDKAATDSTFEISHEKHQDTLFGLKNFKPLVIIKDNGDTLRYWFGDTIRHGLCDMKRYQLGLF